MNQDYIAESLSTETKIEAKDEYKTFTAVSGEFSHAKPKIEKTSSGYEIDSFDHSAYQWKTWQGLDIADYRAAYEIGAKFKSKEAIYRAMNASFEGVIETSCKEINQRAIDLVKSKYRDNIGSV